MAAEVLTGCAPTSAASRMVIVIRVPRIVVFAYLVAGVIVAADHNYLRDLDGVKPLASAALAIALWPLLLLGIDLRIR